MSQSSPTTTAPQVKDARVAIVRAEWNGEITGKLAASAHSALLDCGVKEADIETFDVPGTIELTFAASQLIEASLFDAVIVIGVVVRGDTPHFDYVCQSVTQGITGLNADCDIPVIFGVLTVENEQQALDRTAGGPAGDKGYEAGAAAAKMIAFTRRVKDSL